MKIAVDVTPILPGGECGGVKQLVLELLKGFCAKAPGDSFILLTAWYNRDIFKEYETRGMKQFCVLPEPPIKIRSTLPRMLSRLSSRLKSRFAGRSVMKKNSVDVLFCPMTAPTYHEPGIPTVSIVCDLQHMHYPGFFSKQELAHRNSFYEQLKRKADYIVCISEFTRSSVVEKLGISPERVCAIPIAIHSRLSSPSRELTEATVRKYGIEGKTYCLYPANAWPHKNHRMLLVAFNMFKKSCPQAGLDLVFTGTRIEDNPVLEDAVRCMGISEAVHFLGYLAEDELAVVWQQAHFLIFPSLFEGFGIPLVEAMQYEKPIIASSASSIPEVAGEAALYFDPRKPGEIVAALQRIMGDEGLYRRLAENGRQQLEHYRYEQMVEQYLDVLHRSAENGNMAEYAEVTGIYQDCWAGERIQVGVGAGRGTRLFILRGSIPEWHPAREVRLKITLPGGKKKNYVVHKHAELTIRESLPDQAGVMNISISGGFRPDNGDIRTLTFLVDEASVINTHGGKKIYEFSGRRI
jgi:glycosyltransferase involved in cell wall biosynthesis